MSRPVERDAPHVPVMLADVLEVLRPRDGGLYVDGTFGAGGYSRALLDAADCTVLAIDRDREAIMRGREMAVRFKGRLTLIEGRFGEMERLLREMNVQAVDGVALDVGVSSMQIDEAARGFSFQKDGPLDMRMSGEGVSAADVINTLDETDLARIIAVYGEERRARAIARAIVAVRQSARLERTGELVEVLIGVLGAPRMGDKIHPATRTFQALRIFVNDELGELARGLGGAEAMLREGGRLAVVAFHSLEDRIVKKFLAARTGRAGRPSRHMPDPLAVEGPSFREVFRGARKPQDKEILSNPRSRSARLRAAERTAAPVVALDRTALGLDRFPILEEVFA